MVEISLSETGDRGSECDDCHIRSHVFCIRSLESLFRSHERQIRSGRIVCNPLAEWALCFFSSEVSQLLSSESEVISASSSAIPRWAVKAPVLFLHLWSYVCCLDFDCKVRNFFLNTRCTSMTCTIVKSVKKIKGFYTLVAAFFHHAKMPGKKQLWGLEALFLIHFSCVPLIINTLYHFSRVVYI